MLLNGGPQEVLRQYLRLGHRVVFGAERGCWPFVMFPDGAQLCREKYPRSPTADRFLNSGVWVGRARHARALTAEVRRRLSAIRDGDDQEIMTRIFWDDKLGVGLDYHAQLVRSMHANPLLTVEPRGLLQTASGSEPVMVHHNGNGKERFMEHEASMYYRRQPELEREFWSPQALNHTVRMGLLHKDFRDLDRGGIKWRDGSLEELCPEYAAMRRREVTDAAADPPLSPAQADKLDQNKYKRMN